MKLTEFYTVVAGRVDTEGTSISAAETRRVLSEAFLVLNGLSAADASDVVAKGLATAAKKSATKKSTAKKPAKKAPKKKAAKRGK